MALPRTQGDVERPPQTRCSNCQTVFEVAPELLASSDTRVRCGECLCIFDALEGLRASADGDATSQMREQDAAPGSGEGAGQEAQAGSRQAKRHKSARTRKREATDSSEPAAEQPQSEAGAAALAGLANDTSALDVTYSDFDLFSGDADLPEIAYFDQTRDTPEFDFDSVALEDDETFSDTLFAHDVTINADVDEATAASTAPAASESLAEVDFETEHAPREPLVFNYRDPDENPTAAAADAEATAESRDASSSGLNSVLTVGSDGANVDELDSSSSDTGNNPWPLRIVMVLLLAALVLALSLYPRRDRLFNSPIVRPVMVYACGFLNCEVPARVALDSLKILKRNVYSHPREDNALVIEVSFRNEAEFAQRYPSLVVRLTDRTGRLVAQRAVPPPDYLDGWQAGATLAAGERANITLTVNDPGSSARSFELNFAEF